MSKKNIEENNAENTILEYMRHVNRPYNEKTVFENLKGAVKNLALTKKAMLALIERGELQSKEFGKANLFWIDQKKLKTSSAEELQALDEEISQLRQQCSDAENELHSLQEQKNSTLHTLSDSQCNEQLAKIYEVIEKKRQILETYKQQVCNKPTYTAASNTANDKSSESIVLLSEEVNKIRTRLSDALYEWARRRKMVMQPIEQICESADKKVTSLLEEMGIETDVEAGVSLADLRWCKAQRQAVGDNVRKSTSSSSTIIQSGKKRKLQ